MRGASRRLLPPGFRWLAGATAAFVLAVHCASAPPKPPPPDPASEALVAALIQGLNLDAAQQKRTWELLKELSDRDDAIHAGWANGKRVRAEEIFASHSQFERDFFMVLTTDQRLVFIQNKARLSVRAH